MVLSQYPGRETENQLLKSESFHGNSEKKTHQYLIKQADALTDKRYIDVDIHQSWKTVTSTQVAI